MKAQSAYPYTPDWTPDRRWRQSPQAAVEGPVRFRLWLPLTPICLVLSPFAWLCLPLVALFTARYRLNPVRVIAGVGAVLLSASGTQVGIQAPDSLVRIYIF